MSTHNHEITLLLQQINAEAPLAWHKLIALTHTALYQMAHDLRKRDNNKPEALPDTYAVMHEAFYSLYHSKQIEWKDRRHFYLTMAQAIRFTLSNHSREQNRLKRGAGMEKIPLLNELELPPEAPDEVQEALDAALDLLEAHRPRSYDWVTLRFFTGLTGKEISALYGVSERTIIRDWIVSRHFLAHQIQHYLAQ